MMLDGHAAPLKDVTNAYVKPYTKTHIDVE